MSSFKTMKRPKIQVEVVSDVVCPWCYIGKRRMEKAVDRLKEEYDFQITFSPFELNPDMPKEGLHQKTYLAQKFGGEERYQQITDHVTHIAHGEGLSFHYDKQSTSPNTRDAHRIIWHARQEGRQQAVKEAFLKAYFEDGVDLSKKENLVSVAVSAGLAREKIELLLNNDEGEADVVMSEEVSKRRGISGVPFYIINNQYGLSGAQPSETFEKVFREIAEKK